MTIGIDASRAFLKRRTGIEEYAYQTIKHLRDVVPSSLRVILYVRRKIIWKNNALSFEYPQIDFSLPENWEVRGIWAPRFWTQIGLSLEMFRKAPDALFVPAHTVPLIHPKKTIVTIHGLEYEFCKEAYSFWERAYMHHSIRFSCKAAEKIICVSQNTKKDVMAIYHVPAEKITVIYEGYDDLASSRQQGESGRKGEIQTPYLLFIGRLEERKNVVRIIEAFEILKEKYRIPHQLVIVGKPGYGYDRIQEKVAGCRFQEEIIEKGYVSEEEKWELLKNAHVFLFPTLYEGFGIPVLEAQSVRVPVVASGISSLPEVAGEGAIFVDPFSSLCIAEGIERILSDTVLRDDIIVSATRNVARFDWGKCAVEIFHLVLP